MTKRVAVLGCGYWGKNLVRNFHALGALDLICDPSPQAAETAAGIAPGVTFSSRMEDALERSDIDGVVIAAPARLHAELCDRALRAGKDVLCEKPLALRFADGRDLVALAAEQRRILMVGHILEYHAAILRLRELIQANEIGDIRYIYSNRLNLGKVRREENILWSFAPHDIAVIIRLIGEMPFQVTASGGAYVQPNIADVTVSQLLFEDGKAAHIFVSWLNPFKEQRLVVVGSKKMVTFDDVQRELILYDRSVEIRDGEPVPVKGSGTPIEYASDEPLRSECEAFLSAMETRTPGLTDGESALRVLAVLQALQRSLITHGQPVMLPLG